MAEFPHCDSQVLHAPGRCVFCDRHPVAQQTRATAGVNFTGEHDPGKAPCPAEQHRPVETIERWGGNRPCTQAELDERNAAMDEMWAELRRDDPDLYPPVSDSKVKPPPPADDPDPEVTSRCRRAPRGLVVHDGPCAARRRRLVGRLLELIGN